MQDGAKASIGGRAGSTRIRAIRFDRDAAVRMVVDGLAAEEDGRRLFLWIAPCMIAGVLIYFGASEEPGYAIAASAFTAACFLAFLARGRSRTVLALGVAAAAVAAGFLFAVHRAASVAAPVLSDTRAGRIEGVIEELDPRGKGARLLVRPLAIQGLRPADLPFRIRVSTTSMPDLAAGDRFVAAGRIQPPPTAVRPGGYDFARDAYFRRIGAVGSLVGRVERLDPVPLPPAMRFFAAVDRARNDLTFRIAETIGGQKGAVAAALVTGKRGLIDDETNEALRAAGIYHVVSISGLHMAIAAGLAFWALRIGFALAAGPSMRFPAKKWAAAGAIAAAFAYGIFAGAEVATQRAMLMTAIFFGAVLIDRDVISMRNLALTAMVIVALQPEAILSPGFQMSFAAVAGLVAVYERVPGAPERRRLSQEPDGPPPGFLARIGRTVRKAAVALAVTTLVAQAATSPYALFHFHTAQIYGLIGNALALPFVSFVVMPAAFLGTVLTSLGWDGPVWAAMGYGVEIMLDVANMVAAWPDAVRATPAFGVGALLTMTVGLLVVVCFVSTIRFAGVPIFLAGAALAANADGPDVFVDRGGNAVAVRGADGRLSVAGRSLSAFGLEQWLRADGDMRDVEDATLRNGVRCDRSRCTLPLFDGRKVVLVFDPAVFATVCRPDTLIVTPRSALRSCADDAAALADRPLLDRTGAVAFRIRPGTPPIMIPSREPGTIRPWTVGPRRERSDRDREPAAPRVEPQ